ncbi:MAG: trehalose-phosphatase [Candidatus Omnitrophica bacterium]|nr:trehalose-phosphatase [Candidatus Omnitrophota bacterium]
MRHLFDNFENFKKKLTGRTVFLFLDYDGTLTPIVKTPDRALLSGRTKALLKWLAKNSGCKLAIISGRALKDVKRLTGIKGIIYSGNHGLEMEGPGLKCAGKVSRAYIKAIKRIRRNLNKSFSCVKGVFVEDKGLTLSLHYRLADKKLTPQIKTVFRQVIKQYIFKGVVRVRPGKMVFEIRPPVEWDKGRVVLWLLAKQRIAYGNKKVMPVYIGDDATDEDAFKALKRRGLTIFVGSPRRSHAEYYLKNTQEVFSFLGRIKNLKQKAALCRN